MSLHSLDFRRAPAQQQRGLSNEARALIEEAVRAGRVRKAPMGVSGLPRMIWNGHQIVREEPITKQECDGKFQRARAVGRAQANQQQADARADRERTAHAMRAKGATRAEIAVALGVAERTVTEFLNRPKYYQPGEAKA